MTEKAQYEAPAINEIGTVHELTLQLTNKVGSKPDAVTKVVPTIVGSIKPI